jgi:ethanolamine utilization protein EutQ (cupin superfamily)
MIHVIKKTTVIKAAGNKPKVIGEFIGKVNSQTADISIARMKSPGGWKEPGQRPEFDEYSLVLKGFLRVKTENITVDIKAGEAVISYRGEWVQYSTPSPEGAEYIAVCIPAFSHDTVHRDK